MIKTNNFSVITRCLAIAVCTPNKNWNNEEYQTGVIEPFQEMQKIQEEIELEGIEPSFKQMNNALELLHKIFITKKVSIKEQIERFNQIFEETDTKVIFKNFNIKR